MRALLASIALLVASACGAEEPTPKHVVVIVIDSTDAGQLSAQGGLPGLTPNIDALGERGVRFTRAYSNNTWTLPSTTSLLSGQFQENHGVMTNLHRAGESLELLPEAFARAGWKTGAYVQMIYASETYGLGQGFGDYTYTGYNERTAQVPMAQAGLDWLDAHAGERAFLYLHFRRPHSPYDPRPKHAVEYVGPWRFGDQPAPKKAQHGDILNEAELTDAERDDIEYLYRANLATIDRQLEDLLAPLAEREDTLVVLTADHGEGMGQHGFYGHGARLWEEVVHIPLIYSGYGLEPREVAQPACTVDLVPTLVELCSLDWPSSQPLDGTSLTRALRGEDLDDRAIRITGHYAPTKAKRPQAAILRGDTGVVLDIDGEVRARDLFGAEAGTPPDALVESARQAVDRGLSNVVTNLVDDTLTEEQRAELQALGYTDDK